MAFASKYRHELAGLVLADTRHNADNEEGKSRRLKSAAKAEQEGVLKILEDMIPSLLTPETISGNPSLAEKVKSIALGNCPQGVAAAQRGMAQRVDSSKVLSNLKCPVLIMVGRDDVLSPVEVAESMSSLISDCSLNVLEKAGHLSNIEQPDVFNDVLIEFIKTHVE